MAKIRDFSGMQIGAWKVLEYAGNDDNGFATFKCECACGTIRNVAGRNLRDGVSLSCGCMTMTQLYEQGFIESPFKNPKQIKEKYYKTVNEWDKATILQNEWRGMMDRCYNPKNVRYSCYGGRGIKVKEPWHNFINFAEDNILRIEQGKSLDRINNDGDYCLENTRYTSNTEQTRNRRITKRAKTIDGEIKTIAELSEYYGVEFNKFYRWVKKGFMGLEIIEN